MPETLSVTVSTTIKLLCLDSAALYIPLFLVVYKKQRSLMATLICILLSVLAIWQYSGYAPISWLDHGAAGSFTHYFKLAALLLPAIAIILLLVQQLLKPDQKQADETSGAGHKTEAGVLKAGTPLLEKTGFFIYKLSVWLVAGMVAGLFIATTQGFMPIW
ncbi:hypothetical protein SAMN05192529_1371, partial [Arachidicoccus rhizosphaerae]